MKTACFHNVCSTVLGSCFKPSLSSLGFPAIVGTELNSKGCSQLMDEYFISETCMLQVHVFAQHQRQ